MSDDDEHIYDTVPIAKKIETPDKKTETHLKTKETLDKMKKSYDAAYVDELLRRKDELEGQLSLKQEILEKTDRKNSRLFDENKQLKFDMNILQMEKDDMLERMNELGIETPESKLLSPDARRSQLDEKWSSLYRHEWTLAYNELCMNDKEHKSHTGPEKRLIGILEWCYQKCSEISKQQDAKIRPLLKNVSCHLHLREHSENNNLHQNECTLNTMETLMKCVRHCRHDSELIEKISQKCVEDYKTKNKEVCKTELKFVTKCAKICWMLLLYDPPMAIDYKGYEGKTIDNSKFNQYNTIPHSKIDFVVWPALLMQENGNVVSKGIARTVRGEKDTDAVMTNNHFQENLSNDLAMPSDLVADKAEDDSKNNIYMTMRFPAHQHTTTGNQETQKIDRRKRINPFNKTDKVERPVTHFSKQTTKNKSQLSKSAGQDFKGSMESLVHKTKVAGRFLKGKKKQTKDDTFVSYLTTSSTI